MLNCDFPGSLDGDSTPLETRSPKDRITREYKQGPNNNNNNKLNLANRFLA